MNEIRRLWTRPLWKAPRDVEGATKRIELLQEPIITYANMVTVIEKRQPYQVSNALNVV